MIRILHTIPDLHIGGVANLLLKLLKNFNDPDFEHHLCFFGRNEMMLPLFLNSSVKIHKIDYHGKVDFFRTLKNFYTLVEKERINIIHSNLMLDRYIVGFSRIFHRIPTIITIHTTSIPQDQKSFYKSMKLRIEDLISRISSTHYIAISESVKTTAISYRMVPKRKITVIYSGVHIPEYKVKQWDKQKPLKFISVGRLISNKGFEELIEIMYELKKEKLNFHLSIVGDGPIKKTLNDKIINLNLQENINLEDKTLDVNSFLEKAHLYLNTSKEEGFSLSTVEAMASSLPVIAYNLPVFKELSKNGFYFPVVPYDKVEFKKQILKLIFNKDEYKRYSERCYDRAKNRFNIEDTCENYRNIYKKYN